VKVVLPSEKAKWSAVKNGPKVRTAVDVSFDPKNLFIVSDQTLLQRQEDVKLRESLRIRRQEDPNWKIRKGRLVRVKPPAEEESEPLVSQGEETED
jgi:hypothetical protein